MPNNLGLMASWEFSDFFIRVLQREDWNNHEAERAKHVTKYNIYMRGGGGEFKSFLANSATWSGSRDMFYYIKGYVRNEMNLKDKLTTTCFTNDKYIKYYDKNISWLRVSHADSHLAATISC